MMPRRLTVTALACGLMGGRIRCVLVVHHARIVPALSLIPIALDPLEPGSRRCIDGRRACLLLALGIA